MPTFKSLIGVSLLLLLCSGCASNKKVQQMIGSEAPYAHMVMFDGSTQVLDESRGKVTVIAFWASWCNNSRPVIEELNDFARTASNRSKFVVYAVSLDKPEDYEKLKEKIVYRKLSAVEHVYSGNEGLDELFMVFRGESFPLVIVLDERGIVRAVGDDAEVAIRFLQAL